ncbi:MAG: pyridoxal phosphate-dependent aminotransferase family protein [Nanoarchaeota archaeon]|nr:pyridoxal phosphate-dependent aminotransferase family protein [Nanoarchaeota archaeon]
MNIKQKLKDIKGKNLFREFRTITSSCDSIVRFNGKECIMLASNNYFGLNTDPRVIAAGKRALDKYGSGNVASRLIVNLDLHEKLEKDIARYKKCQAALVYSGGFSANIGIISSVVGKGDAILSDELNHASIIDGCRLSKADVVVYKHCDIEDLESKLSKLKNKNILVVTDSVFSMDGDVAPLKEIINLKRKYSFTFMVDDAHATGIVDTNLEGIDIHMGTLSKTLGSQGGYAAGSNELIDFLRNTSRPFMYSTGLSPADTASALEALKIMQEYKTLRTRLINNASYFRKRLKNMGFKVFGDLQIIPLIIGDNKKTMKFQKLLEEDGIFVTGIRFPTVKSARLRISVMATHTRKQLNKALYSFKKNGIKLGLLPHVRK